MRRYFSVALRMALVTLVVTGVIYPLVITGLSQLLFAHQANGSLVRSGDKVIGSELIGQRFGSDRYFHPRPSAAGSGYDGVASAASNIAPTSRKFVSIVRRRARESLSSDRQLDTLVPIDLVTASGSGLDPDISVASALVQVPRIARARGLAEDAVVSLIREHTTTRELGFLGELRVNVLELNLALDGK